MRVGVEAELGAGLADGGGGLAEGWVGAGALGFGSERAGVVVGLDAVAVAVGLDGAYAALPDEAGGVVFRSRAEDGGDVFGRVALRGADELVLGVAFALGEFFVHGAEVADLLGVAVDPRDRVVVRALRDDLLNRVGVETFDVRPLALVAFEPAAQLVAVCAVAFEEAEAVELGGSLRDVSFGAREVFAQAIGIVVQALEPACLEAGKSFSAFQTRSCSVRRSGVERARAWARAGSSEASAWARLAPRCWAKRVMASSGGVGGPWARSGSPGSGWEAR